MLYRQPANNVRACISTYKTLVLVCILQFCIIYEYFYYDYYATKVNGSVYTVEQLAEIRS